jgi:hypothetical protein
MYISLVILTLFLLFASLFLVSMLQDILTAFLQKLC